jgi:ArsR family transcriptional regulator
MAIKTSKGGKKASANDGLELMVYERQAQICKAFANPVRLRIIDMVAKEERGVSELQQELEISKANLSQHLAILKAAGVLATRREGKQLFCSLAIPEVKQACQLVRKVLQAQVEGVRRLLV